MDNDPTMNDQTENGKSNSSTPSNSSSLSTPTTITRTPSSSSNIISSSAKNYRSLALVDSFELRMNGNINKNALAIGDCDNDEKNEIVIGTLNGELLIYKNDCKNSVASTKELGMIACIVIGDILNVGLNYIVSMSIDGYLKIFHMFHSNNNQNDPVNYDSNINMPQRRHHHHQSLMNKSSSLQLSNMKLPPTISDDEIYSSNSTNLILIHQQQIQSNIMCALLVDFDHDGNQELIVALSDRVVRCYRAVHHNDEIKLIGLYKWEFSDQIGSITLHYSSNTIGDDANDDTDVQLSRCNNRIYILVSQFGGVFAKISCCPSPNNGDHTETDEFEPISVEYCDILVPYIRNRQTSAEIVSNIRQKNSNENLLALCTHDGTLILFNENNDQQTIKWHQQLDYPILSMHKCDLNADHNDELIVSVCNGSVYVIELNGNMLQCYFNQPISSFQIASYYLNDQLGEMYCFIYVTFTNSIFIFYNIATTLFIDHSIVDDDDCDQQNIDDDNDDHSYTISYIRKHRPELYEQMNGLLEKLNNQQQQQQSLMTLKMTAPTPTTPSQLIRTILYELPFE